MGDYNRQRDLVDRLRALEQRVAALERTGPVGIVDSSPSDVAAQGALRKVRGGGLFVREDDAWEAV